MLKFKGYFLVLAKISVSALAIYILSRKVDLEQLLAFHFVNKIALAVSLLIAIIIVVAQAIRWLFICRSLGFKVGAKHAIISVWFGHFLNNVLPTSTAGDVVRNFTLRYVDRTSGLWAGVFVSEKFTAMLTALLTAAIVSSLAPLGRVPIAIKGMVLIVIFAMLASYLMIALFLNFFSSVLPIRLQSYLSAAKKGIGQLWMSREGRVAVLFSILINLGMAMFFYAAAVSIGVKVTLLQSLFVVPVFSVIAALPISYGGWGIRELSGAQLLSYLGYDMHSALAVIFLYGLINLASCLPGLLLGKSFLRTTQISREAQKNSGT